MDDRELDEALTRTAADWRGGLAPALEFDRLPTVARRRSTFRWSAGIVTVGAILVVLATRIPPSSPNAARPDGFAGLVPQIGGVVHADGALVATPAHPVYICAPNTWVQSADTPLSCSDRRVPVTGVALDSLPNRYDVAGVVFTPSVHLVGIWDGTTIAVSRVTVGGPVVATATVTDLACPTPSAGWPADPSDPRQVESAVQALAAEVDGHPELYESLQTVRAGGHEVAVVISHADPATVRARLAAIYPLALCVVPAEPIDLAAVQRLAAAVAGPDRLVVSNSNTGRVQVWVTFVDDQTAKQFAAYPELDVYPLVAAGE
jgi:hypothetical protein